MEGYSAPKGAAMGFLISEYGSGREIVKSIIDPSRIRPGKFFSIILPDAPVVPGKKYILKLGAAHGSKISVYTVFEKEANKETFAVIDGKPQEYDLVFKVYGKK